MKRILVLQNRIGQDVIAINLDLVERIELNDDTVFYHMNSAEMHAQQYDNRQQAEDAFRDIINKIDHVNRGKNI